MEKENKMKYIQSILEFASDSLIYNWVKLPSRNNPSDESNENRLRILLSDGILFKPDDLKNKKYPYSISTTRNKRYKYGSNEIRVVMNRDKVSRVHHTEPLLYASEYHNPWKVIKVGIDLDRKKEFEERIYSKRPGYVSSKLFERIECTDVYYNILRELENPNSVKIVLNNDLSKLSPATYG